MRFIDNMIVTLARFLLRGVMAAGAGLVYIQFFAIVFLLAIAGIAVVKSLVGI